MDIDRNLSFLKISCSSVLEARKRALVLAYLTYDMTRHVFVKLNTGEMLENPFDHQNVYEVQELYNLEETADSELIESMIAKQSQQPHQGMILTDKDAKTLETNTKFKQVEVNENFFNVNLKQTLSHEEPSSQVRPDSPDVDAQISLFDARKLNEQHISLLKQQRTLIKKIEIQEYREAKNAQVEAVVAQAQEEEFKLR